jgi:hypothetical protein
MYFRHNPSSCFSHSFEKFFYTLGASQQLMEKCDGNAAVFVVFLEFLAGPAVAMTLLREEVEKRRNENEEPERKENSGAVSCGSLVPAHRLRRDRNVGCEYLLNPLRNRLHLQFRLRELRARLDL